MNISGHLLNRGRRSIDTGGLVIYQPVHVVNMVFYIHNRFIHFGGASFLLAHFAFHAVKSGIGQRVDFIPHCSYKFSHF